MRAQQYFFLLINLFLFSYNCLHFLPFPPPHPSISKPVFPSVPFKDDVIGLKVDSLIKVIGSLKGAVSLKLEVFLLYNFGIIENS